MQFVCSLVGALFLMVAGARAYSGETYDSVRDVIDAGKAVVIDGVLDLSHKGLTSLEGLDQIPEAEELQHLYLDGNLITSIPEGAMNRFETLETLNLSENPLKALREDVLVPLTNLKNLYLYSTDLPSVPRNLLQHNRLLENVSISGDNLIGFPDDLLVQQENLKTFSAAGSRLAALPQQFFWYSPELVSIDLHANQLTKISPQQFWGLKKVEAIFLEQNKIAELPQQIFSDNHLLKTVTLKGNPAALLPIEKLKQIIPERVWTDIPAFVPEKKFSVSDLVEQLMSDDQQVSQALTRISEDRGEQYIVLDLSNRGLTSLEGIEKIPDLLLREVAEQGGLANINEPVPLAHDIKDIILSHNYLKDLPEGVFGIFPYLRKLDVKNNRLLAVPSYLFGKGAENWLEELDVSDNQIINLLTLEEEYTDESTRKKSFNINPLDSYPHLLKIFLVDNAIKVLPEGLLAHLPHLKEIHFEGNRITVVPAHLFAHNKNMSVIHLQDNKLVHLPATLFRGLSYATDIDVSGNMLGTFEQYAFPTTATITFYPQRPAPLKILAAKALHEQFMKSLGLENAIE